MIFGSLDWSCLSCFPCRIDGLEVPGDRYMMQPQKNHGFVQLLIILEATLCISAGDYCRIVTSANPLPKRGLLSPVGKGTEGRLQGQFTLTPSCYLSEDKHNGVMSLALYRYLL